MKRPSPPARRLLSLFAATTAAVLAMASPAFACTATIKAETLGCGPTAGTWQVQWQITNDVSEGNFLVFDQSDKAPIIDVNTHKPITQKTQLPDAYLDHDGLIGIQTIPDSVKSVTLSVKVSWPKEAGGQGYTGDLVGPVTADIPKGDCESVKPPVSPSASPSPSPSKTSPAAHSASPVTGSGGGGGLPVTGVNTVAIAGVAVALIGGGVVLVLLGRRRRDSTSG